MTDDQKSGLVILLALIAVPLLLAALFMASIALEAKLAIVGGVAALGAILVWADL